jgi:hypothetical protein
MLSIMFLARMLGGAIITCAVIGIQGLRKGGIACEDWRGSVMEMVA